jgi:hypothetical protein
MPNAANILDSCEPIGPDFIFDAHDEYDRNGNLIRYDEKRLQKICDYNNERIRTRGHFSPIGPGHNIGPRYDADGNATPAPQALQPPIWGWAGDFRVAPHPLDGTPCIQVDRYAKRGLVDDGTGKKVVAKEAIEEFPFPSVELHKRDASNRPIAGYIDRIAYLRETPRRDLGVRMYSKASESVNLPKAKLFYDPHYRNPINAVVDRRDVMFYAMSMESPMFDDTDDINNPSAAPSVGSLSADDLKALVEYLKTAGFQMAPIEPVVDIDPAMDAPGGDMPLPGGLDAPGGAPPAPAMFSKSGQRVKPSEKGVLALRERELRDALARIAALEKNNQEAVEVYSKSDAEARAERIQSNGKSIKYEKVVERFSKMIDRTGKIDKAARDEYEEELMETAAPATMYSKHLPPAVPIDTRGPQRTGKDQPMSEADLQAKLDAMRRSGETDFSKYAKSSN